MRIKADLRFILGSVETDGAHGNALLGIWNKLDIITKVSGASCHWHTGDEEEEKDFVRFIKRVPEHLIAFLGGMSLAAPGIIETINKVNDMGEKIVYAIPTDLAARSAIEDVPQGTALLTSGLNTISLKHSLINNAIGVAKIAILTMPEKRRDHCAFKLRQYLAEMRAGKPIVQEVKLANGLIPLPEPKK